MLTKESIDLLLEALYFARQTFEKYPYPTAKLRSERINLVDETTTKLREIRKRLNDKKPGSEGQ